MIDVPFYVIYACIMFVPIIAIVLIICVTTHEDSRQMVMASFFKRFGIWAVCLIIASFQMQQDIEVRNPTPTPTPVTQPEVKKQDVVEESITKQPEPIEQNVIEEQSASEPTVNQIDIKPAEVSKLGELTEEMVANAISFVTSYTIIQNTIKNNMKDCIKTDEDKVSCERQAYQDVNMKYEYRDALHANYKQQMAIIEASKK